LTPQHEIAVQHWAEADGGKPLIEGIIAQQKLAFTGTPTTLYFCEPVRKASLLDTRAVNHRIPAHHFDRLATGEYYGWVHSGYPGFVPLARLCIAIGADHAFLGLPTDANYQQELEEWAYDYLKRHLLAPE